MKRSTLALVQGGAPRPSPARAGIDGPPLLSRAAVLGAQAHGAFVLDLREHAEFAAGHLPGSVNIGLGSRFERTCRQLLVPGVDLVLVAGPGAIDETAGWLAGAGLGRVTGRLDPAVPLTGTGTARSRRLDLTALRSDGPVQILDIRDSGEAGPAVPGARRIPLGQLLSRFGDLRPDVPTLVAGGAGYRSSAAASLLSACGFTDVAEVLGATIEGSGRPRLRLLASA